MVVNKTERKASWILVLHCHLPFVRHPEYDEFLEENWFFEAVTETYIPLIESFSRLCTEGADFRLAVALSPPLCEMLADPLLQKRCGVYMGNRARLARMELKRLKGTDFTPAVSMYRERFEGQLEKYGDKAGEAVLDGLRRLRDAGRIEILTSAATHALLPLSRKAAGAAQAETGCRCYEKHFGRRPDGFWLPECAFSPEIVPLLLDAGIRYSFLESHGVLLAEPPPVYGVFAPVTTPDGLALFARDPQSSKQVWSRDEGYPGDPAYREFYRDAGYDAPYEHVRPFLSPTGRRHQLGLKYHRITGPSNDKMPYDPREAGKRAAEHARHFVRRLNTQVEALRRHMQGAEPVVVSPYDAELFGHWWLEGPRFIENVLREIARPGGNIRTRTPMECLSETETLEAVSPVPSTWGYEGHYDIWISGRNDWIYRHLAMAEEKMIQISGAGDRGSSLIRRGIYQCARELMLAQSSDWPFLIGVGSAPQYAQERIKTHLANFWKLAHGIESGAVDAGELKEMEWRNSIFSGMDLDVFRRRSR